MLKSNTLESKYMLPLNLQLFAVGDDGVDTGDIPELPAAAQDTGDSDANDTTDTDFAEDDLEIEFDSDDEPGEDGNDQDEEEEPDDKPTKPVKGQKDNPTAAAVIAERKKWQEKLKDAQKANPMLDKLMKLTGIRDVAELQSRLDAAETATLAKQTGMSEAQAAAQIAQQRAIDKMQQDLRKQKYEMEYQTLSKDAMYAGIDTTREELEDMAERTGLTLKQAYLALYGDQRLKDREAEVVARTKANKAEQQRKRVDTGTTTTTGSKTTSGKTYNLTPEQRQAAEYGVKKGHFKNIEEYARLLKK